MVVLIGSIILLDPGFCKSYKASCWTMKSEVRASREYQTLHANDPSTIERYHRCIVVWREESVFVDFNRPRRHGDEGKTVRS